MKRPIFLITDFGESSIYAGIMKSVIQNINPESAVIDITHKIEPFSILSASYVLDVSISYLPKDAVVVIVVDPGVGSSRRSLVAKLANRYIICPDNGILTPLLDKKDILIREISNRSLFLQKVSNTFHGRDIFAPFAARLAGGFDFERVGDIISDPVRLNSYFPHKKDKKIYLKVVMVDDFGNIITNLNLKSYGLNISDIKSCYLKDLKIENPGVTFSLAERNKPFFYQGSFGHLELALREGSLSEYIGGIKCGEDLFVELC